MSKKDFIALADSIRASAEPFTEYQLDLPADFCRSQNSRFNRERWFGYIRGENGPSGGKIKKESVSA